MTERLLAFHQKVSKQILHVPHRPDLNHCRCICRLVHPLDQSACNGEQQVERKYFTTYATVIPMCEPCAALYDRALEGEFDATGPVEHTATPLADPESEYEADAGTAVEPGSGGGATEDEAAWFGAARAEAQADAFGPSPS